jgi:hypothetical protein
VGTSAEIESQIIADPISKKSTTYVDVKSETLRDILQALLENVKVVSGMGPRLSVG